MAFLERIYRSNLFIKLRHWEYWPFGIVQAPFFIYWLWLSLKARSLFFFSASNPSIFSGGMLGESKFEVLNLVPAHARPNATLIKAKSTFGEMMKAIHDGGMRFPLIFKPDLGERGWMVRRINNEREARQYLAEIKTDFIAQEFLDLPLEFGVFYARRPSEDKGRVVSINSKEMLTVKGDGKNTLCGLVSKNERAKLQAARLADIFKADWNRIIPEGETIELNAIGNHCLGTKFLNGNQLITPLLNESFHKISMQIPGFYFGRFDLRCKSPVDLENGNVMVMELNGCGAEPAHVYQPGFSIWEAFKVFYAHWKLMYEISVENHKLGTPYLTFREARKNYARVKAILGKS